MNTNKQPTRTNNQHPTNHVVHDIRELTRVVLCDENSTECQNFLDDLYLRNKVWYHPEGMNETDWLNWGWFAMTREDLYYVKRLWPNAYEAWMDHEMNYAIWLTDKTWWNKLAKKDRSWWGSSPWWYKLLCWINELKIP